MGISIYKQSNMITNNIKKFVLDTPEDQKLLPLNCAPGSSAFIISNSQLLMLNNQFEWKVIPKSGGGGEVPPGVSISNMYIDENNHLICELSDGTIIDAGEIPTTNITIINGGNAAIF